MPRNFFSESEKVCLLELITKHNLHKSYSLAGTSQSTKKASWIRLVEEFNSIETNGRRTENQLKKCWDNLKTRQKQQKESMKTGDRPPVIDTPLRRPEIRQNNHNEVSTLGPQISRNSIMQEEFRIRQKTFEKATRREEELHTLKKREREWMMMAAELTYEKAKIESQAAEEFLLCIQAKRKLIELELLKKSHNA